MHSINTISSLISWLASLGYLQYFNVYIIYMILVIVFNITVIKSHQSYNTQGYLLIGFNTYFIMHPMFLKEHLFFSPLL